MTTRKLKIDWNNLIDAFASQQNDYRCYLNTDTGDVEWRNVNSNDGDGNTTIPKNSVMVPMLSNKEGFELMQDYISRVRNKQLKSKLQNVIHGKGGYKRFVDLLSKSPRDQEFWYSYQDAAYTKLLLEWLMTLNIQSTNTPEYDIRVGARVRLDQPPFDQMILDKILLTSYQLSAKEDAEFLALILKGSKSKVVREKNGASIQGFGCLSQYTIKEIEDFIHKAKMTNWLKEEVTDEGKPYIVFSKKGWDRVKQLWGIRLMNGLEETLKNKKDVFTPMILNRHREIKHYFLDYLYKKGSKHHAKLLEPWKDEEVRKIRKKIQHVMRRLDPENYMTKSQRRRRMEKMAEAQKRGMPRR